MGTTTSPSKPRLPASVAAAAKAPAFAELRAAAYAVLRLKIRSNDIDAARVDPATLLSKYAQGESFDFQQGNVKVSRDTTVSLLASYTPGFMIEAWDALDNTAEGAALKEQILKSGVVKLQRDVKGASKSSVRVTLDKE